MRYLFMVSFLLLGTALAAGQDRPSKDFGKPVYIFHNKTDVLASNANLRTYQHLTSHFMHERERGKYDFSFYSPARFRDKFVGSDLLNLRDINRPQYPRSYPLDLEQHPLEKTEDPNWPRWVEDYSQICRIMRSTGHEVSTYGVGLGAGEFQSHWVTFREVFMKGRTDHSHLERFRTYEEKAQKVANAFKDVIDVAYIRGYTPYEIPSERSWQMGATLYDIQQTAARTARVYGPEFKTAIWLQPNYTAEKFKPIPTDIFKRIFEFCMNDPNIDRIYIFSLASKEQDAGLWKIFSAE